jgi:hypothetical protein
MSELSQESGFTLSIPEGMHFLALTSPFFLVFFFVMNSIVNSNIQGFIYLTGLFILFGIVKIFQKTAGQTLYSSNRFCTIIQQNFGTHPSFISGLYGYTILYILIPMLQQKTLNLSLILILLLLFLIDTLVRFYNQCTTIGFWLAGLVLGLVVATLWYTILKGSKNDQLLYYNNSLSSKQTCSRPSKEKFKCSVYKNGELLQSL